VARKLSLIVLLATNFPNELKATKRHDRYKYHGAEVWAPLKCESLRDTHAKRTETNTLVSKEKK